MRYDSEYAERYRPYSFRYNFVYWFTFIFLLIPYMATAILLTKVDARLHKNFLGKFVTAFGRFCAYLYGVASYETEEDGEDWKEEAEDLRRFWSDKDHNIADCLKEYLEIMGGLILEKLVDIALCVLGLIDDMTGKTTYCDRLCRWAWPRGED